MKNNFLLTFVVAFWVAFCATQSFADALLSCERALIPSDVQTEITKARQSEWNPRDLLQTYPDLYEKYQAAQHFLIENAATKGTMTIVVPAYKEFHRLPPSIVRMQRFFDTFPLPVKIIISVQRAKTAVDGPSDKTFEVADEMVKRDARFEVIDLGFARGKGLNIHEAMIRVLNYGDGPQPGLVGYMDADLATPLPEIFNAVVAFAQNPGAGVVIGDRWQNRNENSEGRGLLRVLMSWGFSTLTRMVSVRGINDTQCGFKFFTQKAAQAIFSRQTVSGFAFDVELLVLADKLGFKILPIPVQWADVEGSTVDPVRDSLQMAKTLIGIRHSVYRTLKYPEKSIWLSPGR